MTVTTASQIWRIVSPTQAKKSPERQPEDQRRR